MTKASTISKSRSLDSATIPWKEAGPKLGLSLLGGLLCGLFFGLATVYLRHKLSFTFQSDDEIRRTFGSVALFGTIPHREIRNAENSALAPAHAIFEDNLRSGFAEAYRLLRTNLYYSGAARNDKIIAISSPGPGDGKTLTTLSLSHTLAMDGKRVLVIDADLRKPSHHVLMRIRQHPGSTSILTGETAWQQVTQTVIQFAEEGASIR